MPDSSKPTCHLVRPNATYEGKQGLSYFAGIASETVGSSGICMHLLTMPPGARAKAHLHENHETAIYCLSGAVDTWYGDRLENHVLVKAGDLFYIPAGVPHAFVAVGPTPVRMFTFMPRNRAIAEATTYLEGGPPAGAQQH